MEQLFNMMISAIVGALTLWIIKELLIPKASGIFNKAPNVRGHWSYKDEEKGPVVGVAQIKQIGSKIKVKATRNLSGEGEKEHVEFNYDGIVNGRDVIFIF